MTNIKKSLLDRLERLEAKHEAETEPLVIYVDYGNGNVEEIVIIPGK